MANDITEMARASNEALNRGDLDAYRSFLHPEVEWEMTGVFLEAGTHRGAEEVLAYLRNFLDEFDELNIEFDHIISADDRTLVIDVLARGIGKQSRARVDVPFTMLVRFRDGLVHRVRNFQWKDREQALEAAGLTP